MAETRVCVTAMINGVPVGTQTAWLDCTSNGIPLEVTRAVPITHCAVTQGGTAGGTPAHPATVQGSGSRQVGIASSVTAGLGTMAMACPPCAHITVAPTCKRNPGISNHLQRAFVDRHGRARHGDGRALSVADGDAYV